MTTLRQDRINQAYHLIDIRDMAAAVSLLEEQKKMDKTRQADVYISLARCHLNLNQLDQVAALLTEIESSCHSHQEIRDFHITFSQYYKSMYLDHNKTNAVLLVRAIEHIQKIPDVFEREKIWRYATLLSLQEKQQEALDRLNEGLKKFPRCKHILTAIIRILWSLSPHKDDILVDKKLVETLERELQDDYSIKNHAGWLQVAHSYELSDNYKKATEIYSILMKDQTYWQAYLDYGLMLQRRHKMYPESIPYFQHVIAFDSNNHKPHLILLQAYHGLAWAYNKLGENEQALAYIERGLALNKTYADLNRLKDIITQTSRAEVKSKSSLTHTEPQPEQSDSFIQLQQIYADVYKKEAPTEFWKLIRSGFTSGSGIIFLDKLKESGLYQTLFPTKDTSHQTQNEDWFKERVKLLDEQFHLKKKSVRTLASPLTSLYMIDILLVAKELKTIEDIQKVHEAYHLSIPCDDKFCKEVQLKIAQKKQFSTTQQKNGITEEYLFERLSGRRNP